MRCCVHTSEGSHEGRRVLGAGVTGSINCLVRNSSWVLMQEQYACLSAEILLYFFKFCTYIYNVLRLHSLFIILVPLSLSLNPSFL